MQVKVLFYTSILGGPAFWILQLGPRLKIGGGKPGRGKKIQREEPSTSSTRSTQTPFGGQDEGVSSGQVGGEGELAAGEGPNLGMQIPESGICNPSICDEGGEERASSHKHATTSWRCGFEWVAAQLKRRLQAWDEEEAAFEECSVDELYQTLFANKPMEVWNVPHIIGRGGRVIRRIETVWGVFLTLRDLGDGKHEMLISGPRPACIFAEFSMELLSSGHHSVLTTLSSLRL